MKCIFVCYNSESKGYRLYHPQTKRILVSRDVVFVEDVVQPLLSYTKETGVCSQAMYDTLLPLFSSVPSHVELVEAHVQPIRVSNESSNTQ